MARTKKCKECKMNLGQSGWIHRPSYGLFCDDSCSELYVEKLEKKLRDESIKEHSK